LKSHGDDRAPSQHLTVVSLEPVGCHDAGRPPRRFALTLRLRGGHVKVESGSISSNEVTPWFGER
jgi:hypothetical protein